METVKARFKMEIFVTCPECGNIFDLLNSNHLYNENGDENTKKQIHHGCVPYSDFWAAMVTCEKCESDFDVKGLEI